MENKFKRWVKNREGAIILLNSDRGKYIISQALCIAIKEMERVPKPHKEYSNIEDMKLLMNNLFPIYPALERVEKVYRRKNGKL